MVCERTWVYHYLQGYPCQLGGRNRKYKINVRLLKRMKLQTRTNRTPTTDKKGQPGRVTAFRPPKHVSCICQCFKKECLPSYCSQMTRLWGVGWGLKTTSWFGTHTRYNHRLELWLCIACANVKPAHQIGAGAVSCSPHCRASGTAVSAFSQ